MYVLIVASVVAVALWVIILRAERKEEIRQGKIRTEAWSNMLRAQSKESMKEHKWRVQEQERWEQEQVERKKHLDMLAD